MADQNLTEAEVVMREILAGEIAMSFEQVSVLIHMFENSGFIHSRGAEWVVYLQPNPDARAYGDGGLLPKGTNTVKRKHKATYARHAISRQVTDDVLLTDRLSIIKGLGPMVKEDTDTLLKDINRACHGNGDYSLATVEATPVTTLTVTMAKPFRARKLEERRPVNIVDPTTFAKRTATIGGVAKDTFYVISKVESTGVVVLADAEDDTSADSISATTIVAGDIVVPKDSAGLALKGTKYHINDDSGTYQNLSRTTYSRQLVPPVKDAQNNELSPMEIDFLEERILIKKGSDMTLDDLIYLSASAQRFAYKKQGYNTDVKVVKQWSGNDKVFDQGWPTITHNGRMWVIDNDADPSDFNIIKRSSFKKREVKSIGPMNTDGRTLRMMPAVDSTGVGTHRAAYQYTINWLGELLNEDILYNGRIKNLTTEGLPTGLE